MKIEGTVQGGVVIPDQPNALPDGTRVAIVLEATSQDKSTLRERLARLAGTVDDLPTDMAAQHDHYLYPALTPISK